MCGTIFYVPKCRLNEAQFCSRQCSYKSPERNAKIIQKQSKKVQLYCIICGNAFMVKPSKAMKQKCCSKECGFSSPAYLSHASKIHKFIKNHSKPPLHIGVDNYNWKGGITPINTKIRASLAYVAWRKKVFARDNYTCVACDIKGGKIHADHIKSFAYFPELRFELSNGRTLCIPCHKKTPSYLRK